MQVAYTGGSGIDYLNITAGTSKYYSIGDTVVINRDATSLSETFTVRGFDWTSSHDQLIITGGHANGGLTNSHATGSELFVREKRHLCNIALDQNSNLWDCLSMVSATGRGSIVKSGNKYSVFWEGSRPRCRFLMSQTLSAAR